MPESIDTANLIEDAQSFLAELAQNNTRDWFAEHKIRYDTRLKRPAELLVAQVAPGWRTARGRYAESCFAPSAMCALARTRPPTTCICT